MENLAYQISQILLQPVLIGIYLSFLYAVIEIGRMAAVAWLRQQHSHPKCAQPGYPILNYFSTQQSATLNEIEVYALKQLETVRIVTRITPMLGLIATLIPMGPALVALQENNTYAMGEHLSIAFTAVTISLAAASLTFWVASIKKRWFAEELVEIEKQLGVK
ncbi:MAG: MotA/TolQ/ExbB proton channel family protein [Methylococcales bacterium]|nr:MotA/TolQ/ExbB proton channel family protein [Methylococcales bacterium]